MWVKQWELLHPQVGTTPFPLWLWGCSPEVIISTHWKGAEHHWGQMPRGDTSQQQPQLRAGGKGGVVTLVSWLCWTPGATAHGCYPMQLIYIKRNEAVLAPPMLRPVCEEEMSHPGGERQQQPGPVSAWIAQALPLPCSLCCVPSHCSWENTNGGFVPQSPSGLNHEHKISALTLLSRISPNSGPLTQNKATQGIRTAGFQCHPTASRCPHTLPYLSRALLKPDGGRSPAPLPELSLRCGSSTTQRPRRARPRSTRSWRSKISQIPEERTGPEGSILRVRPYGAGAPPVGCPRGLAVLPSAEGL